MRARDGARYSMGRIGRAHAIARATMTDTNDETGSSQQTISVNIPLIVTGKANGVNWTVNFGATPAEQLDRIIRGCLEQGVTILHQRAASGKDLADRAEKTKDIAARLQNGTYQFGGGGGGPRQSPEEKGWIKWLNAIGHKEGGKAVSGDTLERAQKSLCRQALVKKGMPADQLGKAIVEKLEAWKTAKIANTPELAQAIEAEKRLANAKAAPAGDDFEF